MPSLLLLLESTQTMATAPASTAEQIGKIVLWAFVSLPLLEKLWGYATGGTKKKDEAITQELVSLRDALGQFVDKEALERRFVTGEDKHKLLAADVANQHNVQHEYERERERLKGDVMGQLKELHKDIIPLEHMPGRVGNLEAKFENLKEDIGRLRDGQQELRSDLKANKVELREDMRGNKSEILEAIAKINH